MTEASDNTPGAARHRCRLHGSFISTKTGSSWSRCPKCPDITGDDVMEARIGSGMPRRFWHASMHGVPGIVEDWVEQMVYDASSGPLVLIGPVGTGKSHSACAAMELYMAHAGYALFTTGAGYCDQIQRAWDHKGDYTADQLLHRYATAPFLVLDEWEASSRAVRAELLERLICTRYENNLMRRTIVTSNLSMANFTLPAGDRAADRINEGATIVRFEGTSRRLAAAATTHLSAQ